MLLFDQNLLKYLFKIHFWVQTWLECRVFNLSTLNIVAVAVISVLGWRDVGCFLNSILGLRPLGFQKQPTPLHCDNQDVTV